MPEAGQPPQPDEPAAPAPLGGETTVPPSAVPPSGAVVERKVFLRNAGKLIVPPTPAPAPEPVFVSKKPVRPPRPRQPLGWWLRQLVPVGGLVLMVSCLYALIGEFPSANWWPGWGRGGGTGRFAGGSATVVIDPGHGGVDSGAIALGLQEKFLTLDVGQRVAQVLENAGVRVRMTRNVDQAVSLEERVRIGNGTPGAIFVSIHFNDALTAERGGSYHASGVETYYSERKEAGLPGGDWMWTSLFGGRTAGAATGREALAWSAHEGASLADAIQGSLVLATSAADRGTKERGLYVTRRVRAPAVLVEGGFISHPTEAKRLGDAAYRQKLAEAIASGILSYLQAAQRPPGPGAAAKPPTGV